MKFTTLFLGIYLLLSTPAFSQAITLSKDVFKKMPFSSQYAEDGALIFNVDFHSVKALIPQIEKHFNVTLTHRGEAHITVMTPPEASGWFDDHRGVNFFMRKDELHVKYFKTLQNAKFDVLGIGSQKNDAGDLVFYLVVTSEDIMQIRQEIQRELESRAEFLGVKTYFKAASYSPHITIGFVGNDVHGVSKGEETLLKNFTLNFK